MQAVVYWIHFDNQNDPYNQGYVGVTVDFDRRIKNHLKDARKGIHLNEYLQESILSEDIRIDILHKDEEDICYEHERKYRPNLNIGWNIAKGGGEGGVVRTGYKLSEEFREKRRLHMLGNKLASAGKGKSKSTEHRRKISESNKGRIVSEEQKQKQSNKMKGRILSPEHKEKIRLSGLGKKRGPYKKKEIKNVDI